MKKIIIIFFILAILIIAGFVGFVYVNEKDKNQIKWKVEITKEYINVRDAADTSSTVIGKAYQGNIYPVLSVNLDHHAYVWYEIEYRKGQSGWIASERNFPYVKEYNNPNFKENKEENNSTVEETYEIDYVNPIVKYYESEYYTHDINTINYDHLEIEEDSKYEITNKVYVEDCKSYRNFWIQYIVVDEFGNTTKKVQKIVFEKEPNTKDLPSLSEIRSKLCESP